MVMFKQKLFLTITLKKDYIKHTCFRSPNGSTLIVTSTDGYCTVLSFVDGELGEVYHEKSSISQVK